MGVASALGSAVSAVGRGFIKIFISLGKEVVQEGVEVGVEYAANKVGEAELDYIASKMDDTEENRIRLAFAKENMRIMIEDAMETEGRSASDVSRSSISRGDILKRQLRFEAETLARKVKVRLKQNQAKLPKKQDNPTRVRVWSRKQVPLVEEQATRSVGEING